jgi:hypothetical protein
VQCYVAVAVQHSVGHEFADDEHKVLKHPRKE